jgi:dephospho-CoA kinase
VKTQLWGLTGGIASGKSTAAALFAEFGIPVIDADKISRELSAPQGRAHDAIVAKFGTADRKELRRRVFSDPQARKNLEAILHPLIQDETARAVQTLKAPLVIYEAALLVETGRYKDLDGLIVIDIPRELRKKRLMERDGITAEEAEKILHAQTDDAARRKAATLIIDNSGSRTELREKVKKVADDLRRR